MVDTWRVRVRRWLMPNVGTQEMVNRLVGGNLMERMDAMRDQGLTWNDIAFIFRSKYGVTSSWETLRRWHTAHHTGQQVNATRESRTNVDAEVPAFGWSA